MQQRYENHVRVYAPHHFIFYPLALAALIFAVRFSFIHSHDHYLWMAIAAVIALVIWVSFMMRQHYALTGQNRIIKLEMRFRYYVLTGKRFEPLEAQLSFGQLAALRFASDEELQGLIDRAINEKLAPKDIKKAIKNWLPDHMRV